MKTTITFIILLYSFCNVLGQAELVEALNKNLIKIETISPDSNFNDLSKLLPILTEKNIIGLGEATHGTHEFFVFKHRMIKFLVTQLNYKIFIIEGDFSGSQTMNDYVVDGKGTIDEALMDIGIGVWMTQEFVDLVEWMKKYNSNKSPKNKIRFYGCDMQSPVVSANKIKEYLNKKNLLNSSLEDKLNWFINRKYRNKLSKDDKNYITLLFNNLNSVFNSINNQNDKELKYIKQCKRELEQSFEMYYADGKTQKILRDKFMAENIKWIYDFENHSKTIIWAHNEHIKNNNGKSENKPIGYYLKEAYNNGYYSFGFDFYSGKVRCISPENREWQIFSVPPITKNKLTGYVFNQCSSPDFILDLKSANNNFGINKFLRTKLNRRSIGQVYYPGDKKLKFKKSILINTFDGLIFFRDTEPSRPITN